jgi:hypothetical protein
MYKFLLTSVLFLSVTISGQTVKAEKCEKFAVTTSDGYVNVRSFPRAYGDNIIGTLHTGSSFSVSTKHQGWWQINSPFQGWVAGNQVGKVSCEKANDLLHQVGYSAISNLSKKAMQGDYGAAETLIKMSRAMDGA